MSNTTGHFLAGKKILYGICGIGYGHLYRQLPIIDDMMAHGAHIVIYSYGAAYDFLSTRFHQKENVTIFLVAVPFLVGNDIGIDFTASYTLHTVTAVDHWGVNMQVFAQTQRILGRPDVVISDYEPVCAQYAYMYDVPLCTLDQQSKFLLPECQKDSIGASYHDEVARLSLFFPRVTKRFITSFFPLHSSDETICVLPPLMRKELITAPNDAEAQQKTVIIYMSHFQKFPFPLRHIVDVCLQIPSYVFLIFLSPSSEVPIESLYKNIQFYAHNSPVFYSAFQHTQAVISPAGHSLLSEAIFLQKPLYVIPTSSYEQQYNARMIEQYGYGEKHNAIDVKNLQEFLHARDRSQDTSRPKTFIHEQEAVLTKLYHHLSRILGE